MSYFDKPTFEEDPASLCGLGCGGDCACKSCSNRSSGVGEVECGNSRPCQSCREVTDHLGERYISEDDDDDDDEEDNQKEADSPPLTSRSPVRARTSLPPTRMRSGLGACESAMNPVGIGGHDGPMRHHGYSRGTAAVYDRAVGHNYFRRARVRFERVIAANQVCFTSAADVGCGTGLFTRYLHDRWRVPVYAIDRSPGMLAEARRVCAGRPGIRIFQQDLRRLSLPQQVDLVTANFDMLNHLPRFADLHAACMSVAANLRSGGWFYFDLLTPCLPLAGFDAIVRRVHLPGTTFEQRAVWMPHRRLIGVQARIRAQRGASRCQLAEWHVERAYGPEEIGGALRDANLITRAVYDEENLAPPEGCPARLIILAQKS